MMPPRVFCRCGHEIHPPFATSFDIHMLEAHGMMRKQDPDIAHRTDAPTETGDN